MHEKSYIKFTYDKDGNAIALVRETDFYDNYGNMVGAKSEEIITKEQFLKCYNEWVVKDKNITD